MFTFRGIPCLYYGSEIEFMAGSPIDVGPNMPLSKTGRAYYGDNIEGNIDTSDFTVFGNLSGTVKDTLNSTLSQHIMRLNRLRQAIPALRKGQYSTDGCSGSMAFKRRYTDDKTDSFCLVTISGGATFTGIPNGKYVDAVTGDVKNVTNGTLTANVSGKGNMRVYVLDTAKTPAPGRVITNGDYLTDGGKAELIGEENINVINPTSITLNKTSISLLEGNSETITATVAPKDATNKTVSWTTSDSTVATVSGGKITAVGKGSAVITARTVNGLTTTVKVKVSENPNIIKPTSVTLNKKSITLTEGDTETVTATVLPATASNKTVIWSSNDAGVATVSGGKITAVSEGTAVITVTTYNGCKATLTVKVEAKEIPVIKNGIYFKKPDAWGRNINIYFYSNDTTVGKDWPGAAMTDLGDGLYVYEHSITDSNTKVIFNDGINQTDDLDFHNNGYYELSGFIKVIEVKGEVNVKYKDTDGNVLGTDKLTGTIGSSYTTEAKTISGYTLKTTPANAKGTYTENTIEVIYVYTKNTIDVANGWKKVGSSWYYYTNGKVVTGWKSINGKKYYFNTSGVMQTSKWIGGQYYVKADGTMATSQLVDNNEYYVDSNGKWVKTTKWLKINNKWYYNISGNIQQSKWVKINNKWYYFNGSGVMQTSKWIDGTYYVQADGTMAVSKWVDGGKYYVGSDGKWIKNK
ncbi:putative uncharacterized protein [Eubacterium sp. CAG:603]|nr:putative uncharacterized protein [Eubacterium sp. CAG:603]